MWAVFFPRFEARRFQCAEEVDSLSAREGRREETTKLLKWREKVSSCQESRVKCPLSTVNVGSAQKKGGLSSL